MIGRPSDRLITRMLYVLLSSIAASMPAITEASVPLPVGVQNLQVDDVGIHRHAGKPPRVRLIILR